MREPVRTTPLTGKFHSSNYVHTYLTFNLNTPASCKTSDRNVPELIIAQSALVVVRAISEIKLPNNHHHIMNKHVDMHAYN